ncbi:hypothetical protein [Mariniphaga sp.]|uniref:hypothetical protein n=1 Tax=Mariniphaga sp. TaxID=1954475 RepID=UPI003561D141
MKRPFETWILVILLVLLAANAFYGGISFILEPDGSLLKINPAWLEKSPFTNFLIPGILLLLFMGVLPFIAIIGLFSKKKPGFISALNCLPEKRWGWTYALYSGIVTNIWIIVQQLFTSYFILQPVIAAVGMLIIITSLLPRIQKYFTTETNHISD